MRTIRAYSMKDDAYHEYAVPLKREAIANSEATWGSQYDRIERRTVEGGLPIVIPRLVA